MKHGKIIVTLAIVVFAVVSCSYENTAIVTIDTGIRQQANLSLFDRVLAWLTFSEPVTADTPPPGVNFELLTLTVTATDMNTITLQFGYNDIQENNGKITLEVPAGNQRTFEVVAGNGGTSRIYGGITTIDLSPGQNVNLKIEMGELLSFGNYEYELTYTVADKKSNVVFYGASPQGILAFKIYESTDDSYADEHLYAIITSWTYSEVSYPTYSFPINLTSGKYYRVSMVNRYGEGEISGISFYY